MAGSSSSYRTRSIQFGIVPTGFAIAACVWITAFIGRWPDFAVSNATLFSLLIAVMLVGAVFHGIGAARRVAAERRAVVISAIKALLVAGAVNILLVGSVVGAVSLAESSEYAPNRVSLNALIWVPGSLALSALIGIAGGAIGSAFVKPATGRRGANAVTTYEFTRASQCALALVVITTTFCLILVGGLVTSGGVGLSVPDWPNSYGWNMFLYPFTKMVGGIYYEHSHRLIGSLVGLETLVLFAWLWRPERSSTPVDENATPVNRLRLIASCAFVLVCVQGFLGGARVFLVNSWGHDAALRLAVVHAATAQLFLLSMFYLFYALGPNRFVAADSKSRADSSITFGPASIMCALLLIIAVFAQTIAGAILRHFQPDWSLTFHLIGAGVVGLLVMIVVSLVMKESSQPEASLDSLRPMRAALTLFVLFAAQLALGFTAWWITTRYEQIEQETSPTMMFLTAGHVLGGAAVLLASAWTYLEMKSAGLARPLGRIPHPPDRPIDTPAPTIGSIGEVEAS